MSAKLPALILVNWNKEVNLESLRKKLNYNYGNGQSDSVKLSSRKRDRKIVCLSCGMNFASALGRRPAIATTIIKLKNGY